MLRCSTIALAALALLGGACGSVTAGPFIANDQSCKAATLAQLGWLEGASWMPFSEHVRVCTVRNGNAAAALLVVSVWAQSYYEKKPPGSETVSLPKPLLFTPGGKRIGELPLNFPDDPPVELVLDFVNWRHGLPQEIKLCVASPAASGDQALAPLKYRAATERYEQDRAAAPALRGKHCHGR